MTKWKSSALIIALLLIARGVWANEVVRYGYRYSGSMSVDSGVSLDAQATQANNSSLNTDYRALGEDEIPLVDDVPVGTIIPYFVPPGGFKFSDRWQIALGQTITDPESPFNGRSVPNLHGQYPTYLAGTLDRDRIWTHFGADTLVPEGNHNHGAKTGGGGGRGKGADNGHDYAAAIPGHSHPISPWPAHDHGGDNKPYSYGIVYLIRIK